MAADSKAADTGYQSLHPAPIGNAYAYPGPPPYGRPNPGALPYGGPHPGVQPYGGPHPGAPPYYPPAPAYVIPDQNDSLNFLRRLIIIIFTMFLLSTIFSLIISLIQRPQFPNFSISSASVSSFNISSSSSSPFLSSDFDLTFSIHNPNKYLSIYYERVTATVLYGPGIIVDETPLPDFDQEKENETTLHARLATVKQYVEQETVEGISGDRARGGVVEFEVKLLAVVKFNSGSWIGHVIRVYCDVKIELGNGTVMAVGAMVGLPKRCNVKL